MRSLYNIFHPEVFQGSLNKKNYFEGWYFKHVSSSGDTAFAVIPGISLSEDSHSFVQFIDGTTGKTGYFRYPKKSFLYDRKNFDISIDNSHFTSDGINLNLENEQLKISGEFKYSEVTRLPKSILMPGIMGWYSYVPTMECNHGVVSIDHNLVGSIEVNGVKTDYNSGKGYIEKDWGISFPESWIWLQCNNFSAEKASVMISVAKIPWKKSFFIGFISFISLNGKTIVFATYNGARIISLKRIENRSEIIIKKGDFELSAYITGKGTGFLKAPSEGLMNNIIKESIDSEVYVELKEKGKALFSGNGIRAGLEETEKIFTYFNQ